jgi:hypothetical protein
VGAGVAVLRGVATAYVAALEAEAQVDPGVAGFEAFLAAAGVGVDGLDVVFGVGAGGGHGDLRFSSQFTVLSS